MNYKYRMHDPRIGRFFAVDPLDHKYPYFSPYQFSGNRIMDAVELEGLEYVKVFQVGHTKEVYFVEVETLILTGEEELAKKDIKDAIYMGYITNLNEETMEIFNSSNGKVNAIEDILNSPNENTHKMRAYEYGEEVGDGWQKETNRILLQETQLGDFGKIGDGIVKGTPAALEMIAFEIVLAKAVGLGGKYIPRILKQGKTIGGISKGSTVGRNVLTGESLSAEVVSAAKSSIKVDLMGGKVGTKGFINYDLQATSGIADDVANFGNHFGFNTVDEMVVNNPMASFMEHVTPSMKSGSTMTIRGQFANKNFTKLWDAAEINGYKIISRQKGISSAGYFKSNGDPIVGKMNELVLQKL